MIPNPTTSRTKQSNWLRRLQQTVRANRIIPHPTIRARAGTNGIALQVLQSSGPITVWRFKSMETEFIICRSWNGETEGSTDVKIAKPSKLRFSIVLETIDGSDVNYDGYDLTAQTRNASDGTNSETQVIVPRYLVDDLIFACRANSLATDEDEHKIGLMDMNVDGRAWAATT